MEQRRLQRMIAMLAVFAMLFSNGCIPIRAEENPESGAILLCGMEEHQHSEECYEKTLTCGLEETEAGEQRVFRAFRIHRHTDECYDAQGRLNCGIAEGEYYHSHNEFCYDAEGNLACGLEEAWPHEHTAECYRAEKKLICEKEEKEGHIHTDACYTARQELTCGQEEETGHQHSEECYQDTKILACELEENEEHTHTDDCYVTLHELACGETEREGHTHTAECYKKWNELTCGRQEEEGHTHSDSCYKTEEILVCDKQTEIHHHTAACRDEEGTLICGLTEVPEFVSTKDSWTTEGHRHTEACYENILTCGKTAHTHSEACYTEAGQDEDGAEEPAESRNEAENTEEPADEEIPIFETDGDILAAYHGEDETVTVPDGIREIGRSAFAGNRTLRTVILPDSVELISNYAFADCPELERVEISGQSRLAVIGNKAFRNDTKLDLSFAASVASIYGDAFEGISETPEEETPTETGEPEEKLPEEDGQETEELESTPEPGENGEETGEETSEDEAEAGDAVEEASKEESREETEEAAEDITLTAKDTPYAVTVSFSSRAGIPEDTEVVVSEEGDSKTRTEEAPQQRKAAKGGVMKTAAVRNAAAEEPRAEIPSLKVWDAGGEMPEIVLYQKTLDISLVSGGKEIEPDPEAKITVTVHLPDIEEGQAVEVRHLTDGGTELLESTNNAGTITFTTNSFSLFEFTSRVQKLSTWVTGQTTNTFYGKTANQEPQANAISLTDVTEGLEVLEAFTLTKSSDLWMAIRRIADIALGRLESIVLYTVEDGKLGAIVQENISLSDILRFNLGELSGYALVRDSGLRRKMEDLGSVILSGMMPKDATAEATDVGEDFADFKEYEETIAAYDISILNNGEEYQPEDNPITVTIRDDEVAGAIAEGKTVRLWHVTDDGAKEWVPYTEDDGAVTFEADGFSAYVFSISIEKDLTIDGETYRVTASFGEDAEIPEGTELAIREVNPADYQEAAAAAWNWNENNVIFYAKFLDISFVKDGVTIEPQAPVNISIRLLDVEAGAEALQVVHFTQNGAEKVESQAEADGTVRFEAGSFSVFGFGNALKPLATAETEEASIAILGFNGEIRLTAAEAPAVEEGLEVLGSFTVERPGTTGGAILGQANDEQAYWIRAELKDDAELDAMQGVAVYRMEDGRKADVLLDELTEEGKSTELDATDIAVVYDTGYRHLTLSVNPDEENENNTVTLDGMMPKHAEASVSDVTKQYANYDFAETGAAEEPASTEQENPEPAQENEEGTGNAANRTTLAAYDISIFHSQGEYQPNEDKPISVEIRDERITTEGNIELWHIKDDGTKEQVTDFILEEGRIAFEATGFSVYIVIDHEDETVIHPQVEFHFIAKAQSADLRSDGSGGIYYATNRYSFRNKHQEVQYTQILHNGDSLELITDPGNTEEQSFYGWYVVTPHEVSGTTDSNGIGTDGKIYYTWPALPQAITFESPITIEENEAAIGDTVSWSLNGASGSGVLDENGSLHVLLAPVYEKYDFVNFMLYPYDDAGPIRNVMTRKLIAMGSADSVQIKISDVRSNSTDSSHLIFMGWEYFDGSVWEKIPTVDYTGKELCDEGKDGVYLTITDIGDGESIDLYPIFVEARWVNFVSGTMGSGASFVGSRYLESWGPPTPADMEERENETIFYHLDTPTRQGYEFMGWYASVATDQEGNVTNFDSAQNVTIKYIDALYADHDVTISTAAVPITDGEGNICYSGSYTLTTESGEVTLFEGTPAANGNPAGLKFYDALDRLKLYARWKPASSAITVVYWTEEVEDDPVTHEKVYDSNGAKTITTEDLNSFFGEGTFTSGSTITLQDLQAYQETVGNPGVSVSVLSGTMLEETGAVYKGDGKTSFGDGKFFELDTAKSDASKVIDGSGETIFNVYYDRMVFTLVFHIGRDGYLKSAGRQRQDSEATWDGNWLEYMYWDPKVASFGYVKHTGGSGHSNVGDSDTGFASLQYRDETVYDSTYETTSDNIQGDYLPGAGENVYTIKAKYGANIADRWPSPANGNFHFVNPANINKTLYIWTAYYGSLYCRIANERVSLGSNDNGKNPDINGVYTYMSEELCANRAGTGIINSNKVHHLVAWFGPNNNANRFKRYHILYEDIKDTVNPGTGEPHDGTDYYDFSMTSWSETNAENGKNTILGKRFYEAADSPIALISNLEPQYQLNSDIQGYDLFYSCYDPVKHLDPGGSGNQEYHIYFFYKPTVYKLTILQEYGQEIEYDRYYGQSLLDIRPAEEPSKEGYTFLGWYTNDAGAGEPFDFATETMPDNSMVLYPVFEKLSYVIKIDPNGGEIIRSDGASTCFRANYNEPISAYNFLERNYIKTDAAEILNLGLTSNQIYYYMNVQYIDGRDGDCIPSSLREARYLTAAGIDEYWAAYSAVPESEFLERGAAKFTNKSDWMDAYFGGNDLNQLPVYRQLRGAEHYSFMGWYEVRNGSVSSVPFDFNTRAKEDIEIKALWRLDGGYYLTYDPLFYGEYDGDIFEINGTIEQWNDPENPNRELYADQSITQVLRAPTNITPEWIFRGWCIVRAGQQKQHTNTNGTTITYLEYEPIQYGDDGNPIYYQPGDTLIVDSQYASPTQEGDPGSIILMQAYYEHDDVSSRRPEVVNLTLDANPDYGGYLDADSQTVLPALDHPGETTINTDDHLDSESRPTQILFEYVQSSLAVHLNQYATEDGLDLFVNGLEEPYTLIGFDANKDPEHPTTGHAYVPAYATDSVIAVREEDEVTLYAMWEPKIYVTFVNTTGEDITVELSGNGTDTVRIVNRVNGKYERVAASQTITVPARGNDTDGRITIVLPTANTRNNETFTATVLNDHEGKTMSVSGTYHDNPHGTGCEDIPYGYTLEYTGTLSIDENGVVVTYTEESDASVEFDVNGDNASWNETSAYYNDLGNGVHSIKAEDVARNNNKYEPKDPSRPGMVFIGWTASEDIKRHTDFSGSNPVTWGSEVIIPESGETILDVVRREYLWDFSRPASDAYNVMLYAVWTEGVTVTFDLRFQSDTANFHRWTGPELSTTGGSYVFYQDPANPRYVYYTLIKGDKVPQPFDPAAYVASPDAVADRSFISWLNYNNDTKNLGGQIKKPSEDVIKNNLYDFSQGVSAPITLVTSWSQYIPQTYTFTVKNEVENGSGEEEFTYRIAISGEKVWGKRGTVNNNTNGDSDVHWGYADVTLKNNQQYTVCITVKYHKPGSWDGCCVEMCVTDSEGNVVKNGLITKANKNSTPTYVGGYLYYLSISQEEKAGYETTMRTEPPNGSIAFTTNESNREFDFESRWGSSNENGAINTEWFPKDPESQVNGYREGENNSLTIIFTNTGSAIVAPTGYTSRRTPYILLMLVGILCLALGGISLSRAKKRLPDTGPARAKVQPHKQWVEYRTPLVRGAPPLAPPCPRENLWANSSGLTRKRGDPGL